MDTYPITARSLGRYFKVDGNNLERAYKEHLSGFRDWDQLKHAGDWILLPENVGGYMSIDESMHGKDLYTFLTNKEGHGGPNSLVAVVKGTTAKEVVARFLAIPEDKRLAVKEVTMDFSNSMFSIVRQAFPNATIVIDCFHIMKLAGEALEAMRLKLKRLAQKEQKKEERDHRKKLARRAKAIRYYYRKHPKKRGERRGRPRKLRANERFVPSRLMLLLFAIKSAAAPPDDEDDKDEVDPALGMVYYLITRALFDQMVFISPSETYTQSGQIMNLVLPGWDAFYDLFLKLPYEGIGAMVGDEDDSDFFYQRDDPNGRYEEGEAKFWNHVGRLIPYYKSIWGIENPYQAMENYMFGRKMNSR